MPPSIVREAANPWLMPHSARLRVIADSVSMMSVKRPPYKYELQRYVLVPLPGMRGTVDSAAVRI